ncbi:AMP-binding protein [Streptomyces sp. NPDC057740]|uniref:AMP-binding protein n=1 Tax=Streptomyces sp. NPDC057740 TaxID=3346234 RepID=UPI0036AA6D15
MWLLPLDRRAQETPDEPALADDLNVLSWSALGGQVTRAAARLLEFAPGPDDRVTVLGDNAIPTLVAHLAGLRAGVGTVATSRNLTSGELVDQITDAGVTGIITGPVGAGAALDAARELGLPLVMHGTTAIGHAFDWDLRLAAAPAGRSLPTDRPARPQLVYTSGITGRARATEVRWVSGPVADASAYLAAMSAPPGFPLGPHLVCGRPLQHNALLTSLRHLAAGQPVVVLGRFDAETFFYGVQKWQVSSTVMVPTHFQRLLALPEEIRARYGVSSLRQVSHTGSACPPDVKRAMIDWFGPVLTAVWRHRPSARPDSTASQVSIGPDTTEPANAYASAEAGKEPLPEPDEASAKSALGQRESRHSRPQTATPWNRHPHRPG